MLLVKSFCQGFLLFVIDSVGFLKKAPSDLEGRLKIGIKRECKLFRDFRFSQIIQPFCSLIIYVSKRHSIETSKYCVT